MSVLRVLDGNVCFVVGLKGRPDPQPHPGAEISKGTIAVQAYRIVRQWTGTDMTALEPRPSALFFHAEISEVGIGEVFRGVHFRLDRSRPLHAVQ